jgi:hypothetical protein
MNTHEQCPPRASANLHYSDAEFVKFEQELKKVKTNHEVWNRRVGLYLSLVIPQEKRKCFHYGVSGIFAVMLRDWIRTRRPACTISSAEYLFLIYGTSSKEYDTLKPVARALSERGHSVVVVWYAGGMAVPPEMLEKWGNVRVMMMPHSSPLGESRLFPLGAWLRALKIALLSVRALRHQKDALRALWKQRARVVSYLFGEQVWMDFFSSRLKVCNYRGVVFVADTSEPGEALANYAAERRWVSHHFLHGFTNLVHTRTLADRVYCFSSAERDLFIASGWPAEKIFADGHPRQESLISGISKRRVLQPEKGGLRVLFANQGIQGDFDENHHRGSMEAMFKAVKTLKLGPEEFRIRLHPTEDHAFDLKVCKAHSIDSRCVSANPVSEDLAWANVLITPWSTMAVEAAYAGCVLIWIAVGTFQFDVRERLIAAGYGEKVTTAEELVSLLQRCRDDTVRGQLIKAMINKSQDLGILNPHAADAAAGRMEATK